MSYSTFTDQVVFENPTVNILCNRIYESIIDAFTDVDFEDKICLTGTVAKIIQGAAFSPIEVIPFRTEDANYFSHCCNVLPKVIGATATIFKNRVQLNYQGILLEIWYAKPLGTINIVTDLAVEDPLDIPINIK